MRPARLASAIAIAVTAAAGTARASLSYTGVNLAGAEFGSQMPGTVGVDYIYPTQAEVDYFRGKGANTFRLPFRWERLVPDLGSGALDTAQLGLLKEFVDQTTAKDAFVILDVHNYAQYITSGGTTHSLGSDQLTIAQFASLWSKLAAVFADNNRVLFGLMNEPKGLPVITTEKWFEAAQSAIDAIRATGSRNKILVCGNYYSGAWSWVSGAGMGTANASVLATKGLIDPRKNLVFEVHQYLDADYSGTSPVIAHDPVETLKAFTAWLRNTGNKGFLGEFAVAEGTVQREAVTAMLDYLRKNSDVWEGWTWWAAGPWWGDYMFSLEPLEGGADAPQMAYIAPFFATDQPPAPSLLPKGKTTLSTPRARITLRGTATNASVVRFKSGRSPFRKAKGTPARWKIPLRLAPGRTVVKVRATGNGGNSKTLRFVIHRSKNSGAATQR